MASVVSVISVGGSVSVFVSDTDSLVDVDHSVVDLSNVVSGAFVSHGSFFTIVSTALSESGLAVPCVVSAVVSDVVEVVDSVLVVLVVVLVLVDVLVDVSVDDVVDTAVVSVVIVFTAVMSSLGFLPSAFMRSVLLWIANGNESVIAQMQVSIDALITVVLRVFFIIIIPFLLFLIYSSSVHSLTDIAKCLPVISSLR